MSKEEARRNSELALSAICDASPMTKEKVVSMLEEYNQNLTNKIDRLTSMLQSPSDVIEIALDDSSIPYRAVESEIKQMFKGVRKSLSSPPYLPHPNAQPPSNSGGDTKEHFQRRMRADDLEEAHRYDNLNSKAVFLLQALEDLLQKASDQVQQTAVGGVGDANGVCFCPSCYTHAVRNLDRMLGACLASSEERFFQSMPVGVPKYLRESLSDAHRKQLLLDLEAIELESKVKRYELESETLKRLRRLESSFSKKQPSSASTYEAGLPDYVLSYCHLLVSNCSARASQRLERLALSQSEQSWEIVTRLQMLQHFLS